MRGENVWDLLHAGDWACAHADEEALARVAAALAPVVAPELRSAALLVARWSTRDMTEASLRWSVLADEVRARTEVRASSV